MRSHWRRYWKARTSIMVGSQPISREKGEVELKLVLRDALEAFLRQMQEQEAAPGCTRAVLRLDLYRDNEP